MCDILYLLKFMYIGCVLKYDLIFKSIVFDMVIDIIFNLFYQIRMSVQRWWMCVRMELFVWILLGDIIVFVYQGLRESIVILVSYSWCIELIYRFIIFYRKKYVKDKFNIVIYKEMIMMFKKIMIFLNLFNGDD